jgi:hypothetical protein
MRRCTGLARAEFALLARPRATSGAADCLYLFESWLLGLHGFSGCGNPKKKNGQFCTGETRAVVEISDFVNNQFPPQEWPQREPLTFDTKGEIIVFVEQIAALPGGGLMLFSPSLRIHSSFIIGSGILRIRNP